MCKESFRRSINLIEKRGNILPADFTPVTSTEAIDQMISESNQQPIILFNNDPYCPISRRAYRQVEALAHPVALVDVSRATDVTRHISRRTQIRHESPQIIILHQGKAVWTASHGAITRQAVEQAFAQAGQPTEEQ
jgi:bacillithiol system protein YtxJ